MFLVVGCYLSTCSVLSLGEMYWTVEGRGRQWEAAAELKACREILCSRLRNSAIWALQTELFSCRFSSSCEVSLVGAD